MSGNQTERIYRTYEGLDFVEKIDRTSVGLPKIARTLTPIERYLMRERHRIGGRKLPDLSNGAQLTRAQIGEFIIKAI